MPFFYSVIILILTVNTLLGLPRVVNLVQGKIDPPPVPDNQILGELAETRISPTPTIILPINKGTMAPKLSATSAYVEDLDNHFVFYVKDPDKRVPIASTTKIMTAITALSYFQNDDILTIPKEASVSGSVMGLQVGEKITFKNLLYGLMLNSGNDAAYALAANYPGGISSFVALMNQKSLELGLVNTHFDNPAGFDSPNHYSSAADLAKIAETAAQNTELAEVVETKEMTVNSVDGKITHPLKNLNQLLSLPGYVGIKTGTTPAAKENLVGLINRDQHLVLSVILGSDNRFGETASLIDWTYQNFGLTP